MSGYTKLFNSILASTIWRADDKVRIVWITMLAMTDKHGRVFGSVPGLADFARVSLDDCQRALIELSAPDEWSRSKDFEGRRIEPIDGGWLLLNHGAYREKLSLDERREYKKIKQREYRSKPKPLTDSLTNVDSNSTGGHCGHIADSRVQSTTESTYTAPCPQPERLDFAFRDFQDSYPEHRRKGGHLIEVSFVDQAHKAGGAEALMAALENHKASEQWTKPRLIPGMDLWLGEERWRQKLPPKGSQPHNNGKTSGNFEALSRFAARTN